jgi:hypothetical protein
MWQHWTPMFIGISALGRLRSRGAHLMCHINGFNFVFTVAVFGLQHLWFVEMADGSPTQPFCRRMLDTFLEYETPKVVHISNKTVGFINRVLQLAIIAYIAL